MKPSERDELLIRVDERTRNTWTMVERQEGHLSKINGSISTHARQITANGTSIKWIVRIFATAVILGGSAFGIITFVN